jgi:hypothetical protein
MRNVLIQAKIEQELYDYLKGLPAVDDKGLSNYIRRALIQRSKYTPKKVKI